jgi:hypothetical protein
VVDGTTCGEGALVTGGAVGGEGDRHAASATTAPHMASALVHLIVEAPKAPAPLRR